MRAKAGRKGCDLVCVSERPDCKEAETWTGASAATGCSVKAVHPVQVRDERRWDMGNGPGTGEAKG